MSSVLAVAQKRIALQMTLAGVPVHEVNTAGEAEDIVEPLLDNPGETQVLIVQESLRHGFSELFRDRLRAHRGRPMIVYCPEFEHEESDVDAYLSSVIKPAVGYEIRLE